MVAAVVGVHSLVARNCSIFHSNSEHECAGYDTESLIFRPHPRLQRWANSCSCQQFLNADLMTHDSSANDLPTTSSVPLQSASGNATGHLSEETNTTTRKNMALHAHHHAS
jgi:hypothetical protein